MDPFSSVAAMQAFLENARRQQNTIARNRYLHGLNINRLQADRVRYNALHNQLMNMRKNPTATKANFKKMYNNITSLRNNIRTRARTAHNTLQNRMLRGPPPTELQGNNLGAYQIANRNLRLLKFLRTLPNKRRTNVPEMGYYGRFYVPTPQQVTTLQRYARGMITRGRLINPHTEAGYRRVQRNLARILSQINQHH